MGNWLLVVPMHADEIHNIGRSRSHEVIANGKLRTGDFVYIVAGNLGLCGWGHVISVAPPSAHSDQQPSRMNISITQTVLREGLGTWQDLQQDAELVGATNRLEGNLVQLTAKECNRLNNILRAGRAEAPADLPEIQDNIGKYGIRDSSSLQPKLRLAIEKCGVASLLFLDLDNFKSVNDEYDHSVGDAVLQETLSLVDRVVADQGELFHRTGDEMIVLLPNLTLSQAREVANRVREAIENQEFPSIGKGVVTATIGLETCPETCQSWGDLERAADQTAMRAKKFGKNRVESSIDRREAS